MAKANKTPLGTGKDPRQYEEASRPYLKRKDLLKHAPLNPSLDLFVKELERVETNEGEL